VHTLVINADGAPMSLVPLSALTWQEAIKVLFQDRCDVLHNYEDWFLRSQHLTIPVPSVIMLRDYVNVGRALKFAKHNVFLRDDYTCQYCQHGFESSDLTLDHLIPRARGGKTRWDNVVSACEPCNTKKADRMDMEPVRKPERPTYFQLVANRRKRPIKIPHPSWNDYLMWPDELVTVKKIRNRS
jgi:5-methylcytosine-specific restriction endonuclease McrA